MVKKLLTPILALLLLLSFSLSASADAAALTVSEVTAAAGKEVEVTVSISNNPGIVGLTLGFSYDDKAMELVSISNSGLTGSWQSATKVAWASSSGDQSYNGVFLTLKFRIFDTASGGTYPVSLIYSPGDICNNNLDDVDFNIIPGSITVSGGSSAPSPKSAPDADDTIISEPAQNDVETPLEDSELEGESSAELDAEDETETDGTLPEDSADETESEKRIPVEAKKLPGFEGHVGLYVLLCGVCLCVLTVAALVFIKK